MFIAVASTSTVAALAGCSDTNSGGGERAENQYSTALNKLLTNDDNIEQIANADSIPEDWRPKTRRQRLDEIRSALDTAEKHAPESMMADINNLRAVANAQSAITDYTATLVELETCWGKAKTKFDQNAWEEAYTHLEDCRPLLEDLNEQYDTIIAAFEEIDNDRLKETTELDYSDRAEKIPLSDETLDVRLDVVEGLNTFLTGMVRFQEGGDHLSKKEYGEAEDDFRTAESQFSNSVDIFEGIISDSNTPDDLENTISELDCIATHATTGSEYFAKGAAAAQNGNNSTAREHFQTGEAQFQKSCS